MSSLSDRLTTLEQDFKYAEVITQYKNICTCMQYIKSANVANAYSSDRRNESIANHMSNLSGSISHLRGIAALPGRFEPSKFEEGELCLTDLLARLQSLADAWRSKARYLHAENNTKEWLDRFVGTSTDALNAAWDRANGIKLM